MGPRGANARERACAIKVIARRGHKTDWDINHRGGGDDNNQYCHRGYQSKVIRFRSEQITFSSVMSYSASNMSWMHLRKCVFFFFHWQWERRNAAFFVNGARPAFFECQKHDRNPPYYCQSVVMEEGGSKSLFFDRQFKLQLHIMALTKRLWFKRTGPWKIFQFYSNLRVFLMEFVPYPSYKSNQVTVQFQNIK